MFARLVNNSVKSCTICDITGLTVNQQLHIHMIWLLRILSFWVSFFSIPNFCPLNTLSINNHSKYTNLHLYIEKSHPQKCNPNPDLKHSHSLQILNHLDACHLDLHKDSWHGSHYDITKHVTGTIRIIQLKLEHAVLEGGWWVAIVARVLVPLFTELGQLLSGFDPFSLLP